MPPNPAEQPRDEQLERAEAAPESGVLPVESFELMSNSEALEEISRAAKEAEAVGKEERKELDLSKKTLESAALRYGVELDAEAANDNAAIDLKADEATKKFKNELKSILKSDAEPTEQDKDLAVIDAEWDRIAAETPKTVEPAAKTEQDIELAAIDAGWDAIAADAQKKTPPAETEQDKELATIDAEWDRIAAEAPKPVEPVAKVESGIELTSMQDQLAEVQKTADKESTIEGSLMSMQEQMAYVQRMADAAPRPLEKPPEKPPAPAVPEVAEVLAEDILDVAPSEQPAPTEAKPDTAAINAARIAELQTQEMQLSAEYDRLAKQVAAEGQNLDPDDEKAYKQALKTGDMSKLPKASVAERKMNAAFKKLNDLRGEKNALLAGQSAAQSKEAPRAEARAAAPAAETRAQTETEKMLAHLPPEVSAAAIRNYNNVDERANGGLVAKGLTPDGKVRATYADNTVLEISPDGSYSAGKLKAPEKPAAASPESAPDAMAEDLQNIENGDLLTLEADRELDRKELEKMSASPERDRLQKRLEAMNASIDRKNAPEGLAKEIAKLQERIDANMAKMVGLPEDQETMYLKTIEQLMTQVTELKRRQSGEKPEKPPEDDPDPAGGKRAENAEAVDEVEPMMLEDDPRYTEMVDKKVRQLTAKGLTPKQAANDAAIWSKTMFEKKFPDEAAQYEAARKKKEEQDGAPDIRLAA